MDKMRCAKGFTLIELLIVVAIIAILSAIAVPNFLEAGVRAKNARVQADLRAIHTAVECYHVDNNNYPTRTSKMNGAGKWWYTQLTTPVSYMSGVGKDPFCKDNLFVNEHYQYAHCEKMKSYITVCVGPDGIDQFNEVMWMCGMKMLYPPEYDPTNGTVSRGDVWRISKQMGPVPK